MYDFFNIRRVLSAFVMCFLYWAVRKRYGRLRRNDSDTVFADLVSSFADEGIR
ncbi:hypothetical protein Barb4_03203 [Bacteroidales bacterium Barb4]|nr:hypothetical protein Barb4_03203 [Bacteroidales bacterium Barb4]